MEINATPSESLPGSSCREPIRVEIMTGAHSTRSPQYENRQNHSHFTTSSPLATPPTVTHTNAEDARGDSLGGDSTSMPLTGPEFDFTPQKRKSSQVKRRSQGSDLTTKISPSLDNEASFEKILKNLFENTALHEKIAENINRGLSSQNKASGTEGEDDESCTTTGIEANGSSCSKNKEASSIIAKGVSGASSRSKYSGDGLSASAGGALKELDHLVTGIISETTADPAFESLLDEVFGSPMVTPIKSDTSQSNHGSVQDTPLAPSRLLSTPVPPASATVPQPISTLFSPNTHSQPSSSTSMTVSPSSPHRLPTSPHLHSSTSDETPHHSVSDLAPHCPQAVLSPEASPSCSASQVVTGISKTFSKTAYKKKQKKLKCGDTLVAKRRATRSATRNSRLIPTQGRTKSTMTPSENNSSLSSQESVTSTLKAQKTSPSVPQNNKSKSKKRKPSKWKNKILKEDENNLGEQLLQEFAEFQSSRPDKVSEGEDEAELGKSDSASLEKRLNESEISAEFQSSFVENELSVCGNVATDPSDKLVSEVPGEAPVCVAQEPCEHSPYHISHKDSPVGENAQPGAAAAAAVASVSSLVKSTSPDKRNNLSSNIQTLENSENISDSVQGTLPLTEPLQILPYTETLPILEPSENYDNDMGLLAMVPTTTLPIRSNTIPGIATSSSLCCATSALDQEQYTLTELTPVNPHEITSLEGSYCVDEGTGLLYPAPMQGEASGKTYSIVAPSSSSLISAPSNTLVTQNASAGVLPRFDSGMCSYGEVGQERESTPFSQPVKGNTGDVTTILLPPVAKEQISQGCIITFCSGAENQGWRRPPILIAPKGNPSNIQQAEVSAGGDGKFQSTTTFTLPNNVSFSLPSVDSSDSSFRKTNKSNKKSTALKKNDTKQFCKTQKKSPPGRQIDMTKIKKRGVGKTRKRTKRMQKEVDEAVLSSNIVATAFSVALSSVTPSKDNEMCNNSKSPRLCDEVMSSPPTDDTHTTAKQSKQNSSLIHNNHSEIIPNDEQADMGKNQTQRAVTDQIILKTSLNDGEDTNAELTTKSPNDAICSNDNQKEYLESNLTELQGCSYDLVKPSSSISNTGRSPKLKALLQLSQSISPSKKFAARRRMFTAYESPHIRDLPKKGSQSTPSYKNSHIRALDFSTPQKQKTPSRSPQKAITSLKFSPIGNKKISPKRAIKSTFSKSLRYSSLISPKKVMENIQEESDAAFLVPESKKKNKSDEESIQNMKVHYKKPLNLSRLKQNGTRTDNCDNELKSDSLCSASDAVQSNKHPPDCQLDTEDEENFVLRIDDDDSQSSGIETLATDAGSVELFDLPNETGSVQNQPQVHRVEFKHSQEKETGISKSTGANESCILSEKVQTGFTDSSCVLDLFDKAKIKQLKTPGKAGELSLSQCKEVLPMTPVCLQPVTPFFPSEYRPPSQDDKDLNTPLLPSLPQMPAAISPLFKDYPQGPYSNSSIGTSYYMPSERSLTTDSEGYSPSRLGTVWETTLSEKLSADCSVESNADWSKFKSNSGISPAKMSRKTMGEVIEKEMIKLFSEDNNDTDCNVQSQNSCSNDHPSTSLELSYTTEKKDKDPSKGKQVKQKRVPSKKYQSLESTYSEDEDDHGEIQEDKSVKSIVNRKLKPIGAISGPRAKGKKGKGIVDIVQNNCSTLVMKRSSEKRALKRQKAVIRENNERTLAEHDTESSAIFTAETRRQSKKKGKAKCVKTKKPMKNVMGESNEALMEQASSIDVSPLIAIRNTSVLGITNKLPKNAAKTQNVKVCSPKKIIEDINATLSNSSDTISSVTSLYQENDLVLPSKSVNQIQDDHSFSNERIQNPICQSLNISSSENKTTKISPVNTKTKQVNYIFGSDISFTDESESEMKESETKFTKTSRKMHLKIKKEPRKDGGNKRKKSCIGEQSPLKGQRRTSRIPKTLSKEKSPTVKASKVKKNARAPNAGKRTPRGRGKILNIDVREVSIEAIVTGINTSRNTPPEVAAFDTMVSEAKGEVDVASRRGRGRGRNSKIMNITDMESSLGNAECSADLGMQLPGNELKLLGVAELHAFPEIHDYMLEGKEIYSTNSENSPQENIISEASHQAKHYTTPFSSWGSGLKRRKSKPENPKSSEDLKSRWSSSIAYYSSTSDINITDTEDESPHHALLQTAPQQFHPHTKTHTESSTCGYWSSGCARTIIYQKSILKDTPHHHLSEELGEIRNVTPKLSKRQRIVSSGSCSGESLPDLTCTTATDSHSTDMVEYRSQRSIDPLISDQINQQRDTTRRIITSTNAPLISDNDGEDSKQISLLNKMDIDGSSSGHAWDKASSSQNETITLCAQDSEGVAQISAASIASLLNDKNILELEKQIILADQNCRSISTCELLSDVPRKSPVENNNIRRDLSLRNVCEEGNDNESPRSVESTGDLWESSEQNCLMTYKSLPSTPEKEMGQICHSIVKKRKALVAFPSHLDLPSVKKYCTSLPEKGETSPQPMSDSDLLTTDTENENCIKPSSRDGRRMRNLATDFNKTCISQRPREASPLKKRENNHCSLNSYPLRTVVDKSPGKEVREGSQELNIDSSNQNRREEQESIFVINRPQACDESQPSESPTIGRNKTSQESASPTVDEKTSQESASPNVDRNKTSQESASPTVDEKTSQESASPTAGGNKTSQESASPTVDEKTSQESASPTVDRNKTSQESASPTVDGNKTSQESASPTVCDNKTSQEGASPTVCGNKTSQEGASPTVDRNKTSQSASPTVDRNKTSQESASPTVDRSKTSQESASPTVDRNKTSQESASPTVDRNKTPQESASPTVDRNKTPQESASPTVDRNKTPQESASPTVDRNKTPQESASPTVGGNKTSRESVTPFVCNKMSLESVAPSVCSGTLQESASPVIVDEGASKASPSPTAVGNVTSLEKDCPTVGKRISLNNKSPTVVENGNSQSKVSLSLTGKEHRGQEHSEILHELQQDKTPDYVKLKLTPQKDSKTGDANITVLDSFQDDPSESLSQPGYLVSKILKENIETNVEKDSSEDRKLNIKETNLYLKQNTVKEPLTNCDEDGVEYQVIDEDSDVLRMQVASENVSDSDDWADLVTLKDSSFIDLFSLNLENKKKRTKRITSTHPKKGSRLLNNCAAKNKVGIGKKRSKAKQTLISGQVCEVNNVNKSEGRKKKTSDVAENIVTRAESSVQSPGDGKTNLIEKKLHLGVNLANANLHEASIDKSSDVVNSLSNKKRSREDSYEEKNTLMERTESNQRSQKKRRRIQPIKIGEVEKYSKQARKLRTERKDNRGPFSESEEARAGGRRKECFQVGEHDDGNMNMHERAFGYESDSLRREVLLCSAGGSASERSASSLSSASPGRLLISESPRDIETSPAQHTEPSTVSLSLSHASASPVNKCQSAKANDPDCLTICKITPLTVGHHRQKVDRLERIQEANDGEQLSRISNSYLIESETSRELEEDFGCGRQRRARHMTRELFSGGSLEIAHVPEKQLAIMTNHDHEANSFHLSEESVNSLCSMPPTPGKHMCMPPVPVSAIALNSSCSSDSHVMQQSAALPLKKRKKIEYFPEQLKRRQAQKLAKKININKFLDKIYCSQQKPMNPMSEGQ